MLGDFDIDRFVDGVASSNMVTSNLLKVGYEDAAILAIRKKAHYDPAEFL